jgi:hypothetical protein
LRSVVVAAAASTAQVPQELAAWRKALERSANRHCIHRDIYPEQRHQGARNSHPVIKKTAVKGETLQVIGNLSGHIVKNKNCVHPKDLKVVRVQA